MKSNFFLSNASLVYERKLSCSRIQAYSLRRIINADYFYIFFIYHIKSSRLRNTSFWWMTGILYESVVLCESSFFKNLAKNSEEKLLCLQLVLVDVWCYSVRAKFAKCFRISWCLVLFSESKFCKMFWN